MRDYATEMRALIDSETAAGPYSSPMVAVRIVERLRATDPDLLAGWLDEQAVSLVREAINHRDRSARAYARYAAPRSVFAEALLAHEDGDETALTGWLTTVHVVADGSRKKLAEMDREDLLVVADHYADRVRQNRMQELFLRALAKKVGGDAVGDRYTERQLAELWNSLSV